MSFGDFGVDGFFLLSGYLIVRSWQHNPEVLNFLRKRILRIVPGYLVAALLSTLFVGYLAPGIPHFFTHLGSKFLLSLFLLGPPTTPPVFPGTYLVLANRSLWTIPYEFRCYLLVMVLGLCGFLRKPWLLLGITALCTIFLANQEACEKYGWHQFGSFVGTPHSDGRLIAIFLIGVCFYIFRDQIRFTPLFALLALLLLVGIVALRPSQTETAVVVFGSYLLFYFGVAGGRWFDWMRNVPDISYGIYLYGWPALGLILFFFHPGRWPLFFLSTATCFALGWLSWHFVERPMLSLKRSATAPLPPS